jgi:tRNA-binding protein
MSQTISWDDFEKVDIRTGTVIAAEAFPQARKPAYKLVIDFGPEIGREEVFRPDHRALHARNACRPSGDGGGQFPARQIGPFMSEVLTLGFADDNGDIVLASIDKAVPDGARLM